jgi:anthranilate phosphoribosyltransferase
MLNEWITKLEHGQHLNPSEAESALADLLADNTDDELREKFLLALTKKGESVDEICGFVRGMMARCARVELPSGGIDLCGTGGSGLERFNVSTTVAFVLASMGVGVVKHGNRGSQKPNGSFDLLEKLGLDLTLTPEQQAREYESHRLCFLFARAHHPAVKAVGPIRAKIGKRTIFNLVGPLCNPANIQLQVLGVSDVALGPKMAEVMKKLGRSKAAVVWGEPGIDEFSVSGSSKVWWIDRGEIWTETVQPEDFAFTPVPWDKLPKGNCERNAEIFKSLLLGHPQGGLANMVALNAAAGLVVAGFSGNLKDAFRDAQQQLASGRVHELFKQMTLPH